MSGTARNLSARRAACEPCRRSKLACNHEKPVCGRCRARGTNDDCTYRNRPFKRGGTLSGQRHASPVIPVPSSVEVEDVSHASHRYPNPGFLGQSSHSTIFAQMISRTPKDAIVPTLLKDSVFSECGTCSPLIIESKDTVDKVAQALRQLLRLDITSLRYLIKTWNATGANLALAEPLVARFSDATVSFCKELDAETNADLKDTRNARCILANSRRPTNGPATLTVDQFFEQVTGRENMRLEVLGIFLTAACRAAMDIPSFPPLYTSFLQQISLAKTLATMGDVILDSCLSLDCLSDLQLFLQYENMIIHTHVDGDQSYHTWRRMGDTSSSLFALGYHEIPIDASGAPPFLIQLRQAACARIYTADKMLSVFLGRPPRISREYCAFTLPSNDRNLWRAVTPASQNGEESIHSGMSGSQQQQQWPIWEPRNYMADTICRVKFSLLKEDILKFSRRNSLVRLENFPVDEASTMLNEIEYTWNSLPDQYKLVTSLKLSDAEPFVNDLLLSVRLDYLHTLFLLHLASLKQVTRPSEALLCSASEMLSLITEAIMLRDRLVNSGTSLIWKVAQYGLPAAGIISLALLESPQYDDLSGLRRARYIQDLSVLVAALKVGAIVRAGEANFALFSRATRTMQSLLDSLTEGVPPETQQTHGDESNSFNPTHEPNLFANLNVWDFEMDFWANLADHPTLLGHED
ncbi:unnamed protein product [Clonostachys rosea]|uniref:Zn(2)-C6 fungal-type domain-containing protein n=1 Tax=Bionectria ochroleuca TaxID=29856 RepID=A0ABY6UCS4_BIOOC|nr:unnamed protein product [Clonostachys rosea]